MDADEPIDDSGVSGDSQSFDELEKAVEAVAEEFLSRLRAGQSENYDHLVKQHPELAPHLEARLKIYLAIFRATRHAELLDEPSLDPTADLADTASIKTGFFRNLAFRIKCPHCGHQVQVVGNGQQELTCASCGSSVRVRSSSSSKRSLPPMPERLGHFRIIRMLGEGGFGIVYLAEDLKLQKLVAVKVPRMGFFGSDDEEQRFYREARNAARLQHPNIAQVHEISEDDSKPFIVSDFIDGPTLRDLLRSGSLSYKDKVELLIQIAEAVQFAHKNFIIHRDLKSSNILVDRNQRAFVVDFGLSRRDDAEITMTIDGAVVGTAQYMSPEQAAGNHAIVGPLSDVYSLGVILYEMLCNELPFHGSKHMIMEQVIHDEPRDPHRLNEHVPKDLETITLKAMAKAPSARYASAQHLADDLRRWSRCEPILARRISAWAHFLSWCRRHPTTAALSGTIAALLLITSAISIGWAYEENRLKRNEGVARAESETRQYRLLMQNGANSLESNDLTVASLWFSEALAFKDNRTNRTRIGLIQDRLPKLNHLWSIGSSVDWLAFDFAGSRMAVASLTGYVQVLDAVTHKSLFDQQLPALSQFAFSPTGSKLVAYGQDKQAQLWDVDRNQLVKLLAHTDVVVSSSIHPTEPSIATGGFDTYARIWSSTDGALQHERVFPDQRVIRVLFVPNKKLLVVVTKDASPLGEQIHLWDYENDQLTATGLQHNDHISTIDFADNGTKLCSGSRDGQIQIWDVASGKRIGEALQLPFSPRQILFGGSSQEVVSVSYDFEAEVWNIANAKRVLPQVRGIGNYESAQLDPSNRLLALGGSDGSVSIFWRNTMLYASSILRNGECATAIAFHPDGRHLAVGGRNGMLQLWDLAGTAPQAFQLKHSSDVRNALFSPDDKRVYTICNDGRAAIWDAASGQKVEVDMLHTRAISDCALSPDGKIFVTSSVDQTVKLWDAYTGVQLGESLEHSAPVMCLAISPHAQQLVTGCNDGTVTCWELKPYMTKQPMPLFTRKQGPGILNITYDRTGNLIAAASSNGEVHCWNAIDGEKKSGPFMHAPAALDCTFTPDSTHLLSAGSNSQTLAWNLATDKIDQSLQCAGEVNSLSWSRLGTYLSTNESKGRCRVWQLNEGKFQTQFELQHPAIESVSHSQFNRDNSVIAFAGGSYSSNSNVPLAGAAVLWDLAEQLPLGPPLGHLAAIRRVRFDSTGSKLLTAADDHTARLWFILPTQLSIEEAVNLGRLYAQMTQDASGRLTQLSPEQQLRIFAELSRNASRYFICDAAEIEAWNNHSAQAQ